MQAKSKCPNFSTHHPQQSVAERNVEAWGATSRGASGGLSADATGKSHQYLLAHGADDYLPKPFNVTTLLKKIDGLVKAAQYRPQAEPSTRHKKA